MYIYICICEHRISSISIYRRECHARRPTREGAVCCRVLQCVAVCCSVLQRVAACCSVLQCVLVCCSVSQCVAACCNALQCGAVSTHKHLRQAHRCLKALDMIRAVCCSVCCSVLQCVLPCVAVCCSVLQRVAMSTHTHLHRAHTDFTTLDMIRGVCCSVLQCVAVCCSVLQCVAVCCSVLQRVAVSTHTHLHRADEGAQRLDMIRVGRVPMIMTMLPIRRVRHQIIPAIGRRVDIQKHPQRTRNSS